MASLLKSIKLAKMCMFGTSEGIGTCPIHQINVFFFFNKIEILKEMMRNKELEYTVLVSLSCFNKNTVD